MPAEAAQGQSVAHRSKDIAGRFGHEEGYPVEQDESGEGQVQERAGQAACKPGFARRKERCYSGNEGEQDQRSLIVLICRAKNCSKETSSKGSPGAGWSEFPERQQRFCTINVSGRVAVRK